MPRGSQGDFTIVGANQLDALARKLKDAGDTGKGLRKELLKQIRTSMKPLVKDVKDSADEVLPNRISATVKKNLSVRTRATGRQAGVRVIAKRGSGLNDGRLRHPLFGNRDRWYQQDIEPGWFSRPLEEGAPAVREVIVQAIEDIARKLER